MFNAKELFQERFKEHMKLLNRYLRYIFNGHFMIALIFILVTVSVYYQQMIEQITDPLIPTIVMAVVFGIVVTYNPLQFFLKEPDKVFIIVKERAMTPYFKRTFLYNYFFQLYIVLFTVVAIGPLYTHIYPEKGLTQYGILIGVVLILKAVHMWMNWYMLRSHDAFFRKQDIVLRAAISIYFFYFLLASSYFTIVFIMFLSIVLLRNTLTLKKQQGLAWDVLIENDKHRLAQFYRFVSMFAEAPQITKRMKKRRLLTNMVEKQVSFSQKKTYDYLYRLTFIRSSDYLNMYIRLIVIGTLFILFIPNDVLKILFGLLFIYMAIFQMVSLYYHHQTSMWLDIYPVDQQEKRNRYIAFSSNLTIAQTILFTLVFVAMTEFQLALIMFSLGLLFNYLFHSMYIEKRINK
ncbi:MAG TPA: ABC transporter permease [Candidatus Pseudogracilibacillus intestinigallinarum]|uniref:ABC transporter permease n=1 Tax=Candidatus Pseudogracilibacillus intestinigallinarum TaxID=2838742 RepID=A0A9D1TLI4_9BACI|nr:ABC transporter permease [Candidatus Pseudogracilibacillus intestinigallinarum]